jgi:cytochrome bd-type quinol oxidase subunit 2
MNVSTFYALFSTTCFALVGLWWGVIQRNTQWVRDPVQRRAIGGVHLAFLLPALMGLFAQVGDTHDQRVWRLGFVLIAATGVVATLRLLATDAAPAVMSIRVGAALVYAVVAIVGAFPEIAGVLGLRAIQAEALLLVLLVALGHALAWRFLVHGSMEYDVQDR